VIISCTIHSIILDDAWNTLILKPLTDFRKLIFLGYNNLGVVIFQ